MRKEDEFDLMIKSILDDGQEEVPARIWDSINSRLDNIEIPKDEKKKSPVLIWLRNTGITLAAAAAIATAVIFSGTTENSPHVPETAVAVVEKPLSDKASDTEDNIIIQDLLAEDHSSASSFAKENTVPTSVTNPEELIDMISEEETVIPSEKPNSEVSVSRNKKSEDTYNENAGLPDPFAEFEEEDTYKRKNKIKTSFTLSGNATSNSNAERSKELSFMAPGIPRESKVTESSDSRYGIPVSFGIGAKISFTKHWSMSIGLNYTFLSRTFDGNFYDVKEDGTYTNTHFSDIRNTQNYIGIPLNVYYSILSGDFVDFYAYAGGSADYCLNNKYLMNGTTGKVTHNGPAGSFQFSVNAGIGVEFIIARKVGIYIDPSIRYHFRNSNAPKSIRTEQPLMIGFEAGLRIRL